MIIALVVSNFRKKSTGY